MASKQLQSKFSIMDLVRAHSLGSESGVSIDGWQKGNLES